MNVNKIPEILSLNGKWQCGKNRKYNRNINVPGLATDPKIINDGSLWYKKYIKLPKGDWTHSTLILNGARFCPSVFVNGKMVSAKDGGMTVTKHLLECEYVKPAGSIELEIALKSLMDVEESDASRLPDADLWRTNISSCLWDDVKMKFHKYLYIDRIIPNIDIEKDCINVYWKLNALRSFAGKHSLLVQVIGQDGEILAETKAESEEECGYINLELNGKCSLWSTINPVCYKLRILLYSDEELMDYEENTLGIKKFGIDGLQFSLNNTPVKLRTGTIVWHRWVRDSEAEKLAFWPEWFEKNILLRLKGHGANTLRFHLGSPPEAFLDLCDKHGMLVQMEWHFFHGIKASKESLIEQWRNWLDLCMKHPSVCVIHAWNETEGDELETAYEALNELTKEYPPLVISHRDVIHIHKYWWSLFENIGVYYDSAMQFGQPIIADEFGGNYLDGEGNPGLYPVLNESFSRFLGHNHTKELRLQLHTESNARIAEYWRRIGAAGFSPFCIAGSQEDGSHHFMGVLQKANPKPVWDALTAAYSPLSISIDVWDRNYFPGQSIELPFYLFNDTGIDTDLKVSIRIRSEKNVCLKISEIVITKWVPKYSMLKRNVSITLPQEQGNWVFEAELINKPDFVKHRVISSWRFRTMKIKSHKHLKNLIVGVPEHDKELIEFFKDNGLNLCPIESKDAHVIVTGRKTWEKHLHYIKCVLKKAVKRNCPVLMLDVGPVELGQGYITDSDIVPLQGVMNIENPETTSEELFEGITVSFKQMPEPESCIHANEYGTVLWKNIDKQATWLWNGLRGGIIVPARDMEVSGINETSFLTLWAGRGADTVLIKGDNYLAYELAGYYAFSIGINDNVKNELQNKVKFLVEDAPALKVSINPDAPVVIHPLSELYKKNKMGKAKSLSALAVCGKNLSRTPVVEIDFGMHQGKLILSQLITSGRLASGYGQPGFYGIRIDPSAQQFVINMLEKITK